MKHQILSCVVSAIALVAVLSEVASNDVVINLVLYLPFYGYPMLLGMFLSVCSEKPKSQALLAAGSVLFTVWYFFAMNGAFNLLHNAHDEIGYMAEIYKNVNYVLVGVYAFPFMLALWSVVAWFEKRERPGFYKKGMKL